MEKFLGSSGRRLAATPDRDLLDRRLRFDQMSFGLFAESNRKSTEVALHAEVDRLLGVVGKLDLQEMLYLKLLWQMEILLVGIEALACEMVVIENELATR